MMEGLIYDLVKVLSGIILGFLISRFTMSKAEGKLHKDRLFKNTKELKEQLSDKSNSFKKSLNEYVKKDGNTTLDDFSEISTAGTTYFNHLKSIADAILNDSVTKTARDQDFVPELREALQKSIPAYYKALAEIAKKVKAPYYGKFRRENYETVFIAVEKHGSQLPPPVSQQEET